MFSLQAIKRQIARFAKDESGVVTVEFVLIFPIFFGFFLMTYESGMISLRHVMLEHGVDVAVRDVRIGAIATPTVDNLKARICSKAGILPDCEDQIRLELIEQDLRSWTPMSSSIGCVDRGNPAGTPSTVAVSSPNRLMFLRACIRLDPVLPASTIGFTGLGRTIKVSNDDTASGGSYALVALSAFVVEPKAEEIEVPADLGAGG